MRVLAASTLLLPVLVSAISHPATSASSSSSSASAPDSVATEPSPSPTPAASPTSDDWVVIQTLSPSTVEVLSADPTDTPLSHLELREVVNGAAAAQPAAVTQQPPVFTLTQWVPVNGQVQQVVTMYTQTFAPVPDQGPQPSPGSIGLGTIAGTIGVVKTKREEPVQATIVPRSDNGSPKMTGASSVLALLVAIAVMVVA